MNGRIVPATSNALASVSDRGTSSGGAPRLLKTFDLADTAA